MTKQKSKIPTPDSVSKPVQASVVVEDMSQVYGSTGPVNLEALLGLEGTTSDDIGSGFVPLSLTKKERAEELRRQSQDELEPTTQRESSYDVEAQRYDSRFWIVRRAYNRNYLSRSKVRLFRDLKNDYSSDRGMAAKLAARDILQTTKPTKEQETHVLTCFERSQTSLETFLIKEVLPSDMSYSSALDKATQLARVLMDDPELTLEQQYLKMAKDDSLALAGIIHFFNSAKIPKTVLMHYLFAFITNKFHRG